jgi:hypothetical protein
VGGPEAVGGTVDSGELMPRLAAGSLPNLAALASRR